MIAGWLQVSSRVGARIETREIHFSSFCEPKATSLFLVHLCFGILAVNFSRK